MLPNFMTQSVTRIRPTTKTVRGSDIPDWDHVTTLTIGGCSVQPASSDLSQDGRVLGIMDGMTCNMPPTADVREGDRIKFDGNVYTINGVPRVWPSAGGLAHIQLNLRRWEG